jgi:hypothetical protein
MALQTCEGYSISYHTRQTSEVTDAASSLVRCFKFQVVNTNTVYDLLHILPEVKVQDCQVRLAWRPLLSSAPQNPVPWKYLSKKYWHCTQKQMRSLPPPPPNYPQFHLFQVSVVFHFNDLIICNSMMTFGTHCTSILVFRFSEKLFSLKKTHLLKRYRLLLYHSRIRIFFN